MAGFNNRTNIGVNQHITVIEHVENYEYNNSALSLDYARYKMVKTFTSQGDVYKVLARVEEEVLRNVNSEVVKPHSWFRDGVSLDYLKLLGYTGEKLAATYLSSNVLTKSFEVYIKNVLEKFGKGSVRLGLDCQEVVETIIDLLKAPKSTSAFQVDRYFLWLKASCFFRGAEGRLESGR